MSPNLKYDFQNPQLLQQALTHRSYCAENPEAESYERLEFLGDAVLGVVVTDEIYKRFPELPEGEMAKLRAAIVNAETLADIAIELDLGAGLLLGRGEDASGGREKPSILADTVESVLAAIYLDGGLDAVWPVITDLFVDRIELAGETPGHKDYKTRFQELAAQIRQEVPRYEVTFTGPDHARTFHATVSLSGQLMGEGDGRSKKQAEQEAAGMAWKTLSTEASLKKGRRDAGAT